MSLEQEAADLLERAADGFESGRYYWTRGQYSRMVFGTRAYCSLGALGHEAGWSLKRMNTESYSRDPVLRRAVSALAATVGPLRADIAGAVVNWNDHIEWTDDRKPIPLGKGPVIEAMKHAAKELHNKTGDNV